MNESACVFHAGLHPSWPWLDGIAFVARHLEPSENVMRTKIAWILIFQPGRECSCLHFPKYLFKVKDRNNPLKEPHEIRMLVKFLLEKKKTSQRRVKESQKLLLVRSEKVSGFAGLIQKEFFINLFFGVQGVY